ncbi:ead/Ea22-like family protein [Enterobacter asburiae]
MSNTDKQALREAAANAKIAGEAPVMPFDQRITALNDFMKQCTPATVMSLLDELEAKDQRIAVLEASHGNLREAMAAIHNTITGGGAYTPLAAILNASKRAYEESAAAAAKGE